MASPLFRLLLDACAAGMLDDVVNLLQQGAHVDNDDGGKPFRVACGAGHLHVAQCLYTLGIVDVYGRFCKCFWKACSRGHLAVAQWLAGLRELDLDDLVAGHALHLAFCDASGNGHLHVLQWLFLMRPVPPRTLRQSFALSCQCVQLHVARWLWAVAADAVDVHACVRAHWRMLSVSPRHRPLAQWLLQTEAVHAAWPPEGLRALQEWSAGRDAWMRSVVCMSQS